MDFYTVSWFAEQALRVLKPEALHLPMAIDTRSFLETEALGVTVSSACMDAMGPHEGRYYPEDRLIVLREDHFEALLGHGEGVWRARATLAHELAHHLLRDDPRVTDEEGDAWACAGCLLMPCDVVVSMAVIAPAELSRTFCVSPQFARAHLERMKRAGMI